MPTIQRGDWLTCDQEGTLHTIIHAHAHEGADWLGEAFMNSQPNACPTSVGAWIAALDGVCPWEHVSPHLRADAEFRLANRKTLGRDAIIKRMRERPSSMLQQIVWRVQPCASERSATVRGSVPGGMMPSPGGPMSALDFELTLDSSGLIACVELHPHHLEPPNLSAPLPIGAPAPLFTLLDINGCDATLRPQSSAATLVVFTCNHCPWALAWHERIQQLARDYASLGVTVLQINSNDPLVSPRDSLEVSRTRVANAEFAGPLLLDPGQIVARTWGARHTPELFLLDRWGHLTYHGAPDADSENDSFNAIWAREALDATLTGRPVGRPETPPMGCTIKWSL